MGVIIAPLWDRSQSLAAISTAKDKSALVKLVRAKDLMRSRTVKMTKATPCT